MAVVHPDPETLIIDWFVYYLDHFEHTGRKVAAKYVDVEIWMMRLNPPTDWFIAWKGKTKINGMAQAQITFDSSYVQDFPNGAQLRTRFYRENDGLEPVEREDEFAWGLGHAREQGIREVNYVPHPDPTRPDISREWDTQEPLERLAYSFTMSLAIIMTFKAIQGFSMERFNPVA
jgi:hypothetical protein